MQNRQEERRNQKERKETQSKDSNKEGSGRRAEERQERRALLSWISGESNLEADLKLRGTASQRSVNGFAALWGWHHIRTTAVFQMLTSRGTALRPRALPSACAELGRGGGWREASMASLQNLPDNLKNAARVWECRLASTSEKTLGKGGRRGAGKKIKLFPIKAFLRKEVI